MFRRLSLRTIALVALLGLCSPATTRAYNLDGKKWTTNRNVVMHLSLGGPILLQDGFHSFNESAADALSAWNNYMAHMQFVPNIGSRLAPSDNDDNNSVFFASNIYGDPFGSRVIAIALISSRGTVFMEADVIFNSHENWDSYRGSLQQGTLDFHRVALHEFGHVLGLDHPDEDGQHVVAVMNSVTNYVDALQADDIAGAQSIYSSGPPYLSANPAPNLVNLSTRAFVGTGGNVLIGGFIIQGPQPATVVLRAIGGSLAAHSVSSPLNDPLIELRNASGTLVSQNDDWIDGTNAVTIASYRLDPSNSLESALLQTLSPGSYTAIVKSFDNGDGNLTGVGLVELYDLHTSGGRAGNISTRGQVLTGDNVTIAGFIVGGSQAKEVVLRGIGPTLRNSGITNALADPLIELHDSSGALLATNDNWQSDVNAGRVQQVALAPTQPVEAALDRTLSPGAYTVILRGVNGATGVGLIEAFDLSPGP